MLEPSDNDPDANEELLHDLIAEYHDRLDQGESLKPSEFAAEHPELEAALSRYFDNVATLESLAGPTASQAQSDSAATVISSDTHDGAPAETMIENSSSGDSARLSKDAPRTKFGRYRIVQELGRGAMGAVYLAHDEQLDREVALKIPQFDADMNDDLLERFYREARAAAALQHSGICPVYDVGELDGQHYITMGFIKGRPLRDFTRSSKRQEGKQVARVIRKIAMAMAEAHDHNVVHRDLKPANIMINDKNEPVVMDFGLARRSAEGEERLTHTGTVIGTPAYMSPEQVDGDNDLVGPHSDIYSLGVIFYEMLTGQLPFQGNLMSILKQISMSEPKAPTEIYSDIDPLLQAICLSMMAKQREDRPASMSDVARELTLWLQGRHIVADETEPLESSQISEASSASSDEATAALMDSPVAATVMREPESTASMSEGDNGRVRFSKNRWPLIAGALGGAAVLLAGIMFIVQLGKVKVQITLDDPSYSLKVDGDALLLDGGRSEIRLSADEHKLTVMQGDLVVDAPKSFTVKKDGKNAVTVFVMNDEVIILPDGEQPPSLPVKDAPPAESLTESAIASSAGADTGVWTTDWEWTKPIELGQLDAPSELKLTSADGFSTVLFEAGKPGSRDIWQRDRLPGTSTWSKPRKLDSPINTSSDEASPFLSRDGKTLIFESDRPGGFGRGDLWISTRSSESIPWSIPVNLGKDVNTAQSEGLATLSANGLQLIFASDRRESTGLSDLWECTRGSVNDSWSPARNIKSLNSVGRDLAPLLSADGLSLVLTSDRAGGEGSADFWLSRRLSPNGTWSKPVNPGPGINTPAFEYGLLLSADSKSLIYNSSLRGKRSTWLSRRIHNEGTVVPQSQPKGAGSPDDQSEHLQALAFDPQRSYVEVPTLRCDGHAEITMEAWITPDEKRSAPALTFVLTGGHSLSLQVGGNPRWEFGGGIRESGVYRWASGPQIQQWGLRTHVAGTYGNGLFTVFVNGEKMKSVNIPDGHKPAGPLCIGRSKPDTPPNGALKGSIDEVRISSIARYKEDFTPEQRFESDADTLALYHFEEGRRDVLHDSSGNNHHGKIVDAEWVRIAGDAPDMQSGWSEFSGHALEFDGVDDHVQLPDIPVDGTAPFTTEVWVEVGRGLSKGRKCGVFNFVDPKGGGYLTGVVEGTGRWGWIKGTLTDTHYTALGRTDYSSGWSHVAVICDGLEVRSFVNGEEVHGNVRTSKDRADPSVGAYTLGARIFSGTKELQDFLYGRIRACRVSYGARYSQNFEPPFQFDADEQTVALYRFQEGTGDVLKDSSGNNLHGKIVGAKWVNGDDESEQQINLLAGADSVQLDTEKMKWQINDGVLTGKGTAKGDNKEWSGIRFPQEISGDYDLELEFRQSGFAPLQIDLPLGHKQAIRVHLGGLGCALMMIDGKGEKEADSSHRNDELKMKKNVWHRLTASVRHDGDDVTVDVALDGVRLGKFSGARSRISIPHWVEPDAVHLKMTGYGLWPPAQLEFRRALVSPASPATTVSQQVPDEKTPPLAVAPFDEAQAKAHQQAWADYLGIPVEKEIELPGNVRMTFALIPPGEFMMGAMADEPIQFESEKTTRQETPQHRVRISRPFYIGIHEVTQAQWMAVMGSNPSMFASDLSIPVNRVSWNVTEHFASKLSREVGDGQFSFSLPTEAEWEYACRAGTTTSWHCGNDDSSLTKYAWIETNALGRPELVGKLRPNSFGLFDMHGNVWEYCSDWFSQDYFHSSPANDPTGPESGTARVLRGGWWRGNPDRCRSAHRSEAPPDGEYGAHSSRGFRLKMTLKQLTVDSEKN